MPVCTSIPEKENAPVIVKMPVELVCRVSVPEPVAALDISKAAPPVEARRRPAGLTLIEPELIASAFELLPWVMERTLEPTPPWILFVPLVPVPTTPPRTAALLNRILPALFTG